jgi:predicted nucleic acid-binding protein
MAEAPPRRTPRAADALDIAIIQRTGCALLSFDLAMAKVARELAIGVIKA